VKQGEIPPSTFQMLSHFRIIYQAHLLDPRWKQGKIIDEHL